MKHSLYISLALVVLESITAPLIIMATANAAPDRLVPTTNVTANDVSQVLQTDTNQVNQTVPAEATNSGYVAASAGASVTIPDSSSSTVTMAQPGLPTIGVGLPEDGTTSSAQTTTNGLVAYRGTNGAANAVAATAEGMQLLTVIVSPSAPTIYNYPVSVPQGGSLQLNVDGSVMVLDNTSQPVAYIATPWAHDANGKPITTWFSIDGTTLVQHIDHTVAGVAYPVVADPSVWKVIECTAAVGTLAVLTWVGVQDVRDLGGVAAVAKLLLSGGATASRILATFGYISGITAVKDAC
jgi:hypothetical protein